jgi:taurine dioxygenase
METVEMNATSLRFTPLSPAVGADVDGIDLSGPMSDTEFRAIVHAWHHIGHGLLRFRGQTLSSADIVRFSERFGRLEIYRLRPEIQVEGCPELVNITHLCYPDGRPMGLAESGRRWHSDLQFKAEPAIASAFYCLECEGGDTLFAGMHAAYEALPDAVKRQIEPLQAVQSYTYYNDKYGNRHRDLNASQVAQVAPVTHPVVRVHPATGRKALYVSEGMTERIVGLSDSESSELLEFLIDFSTRPEFLFRQVHRPGDLLLWDNRCTMHQARPYDLRLRRHMRRSTIMARDVGI